MTNHLQRQLWLLALVFGVLAAGGGMLRGGQRDTTSVTALFQEGLRQEVALGNPKAAIAVYERILAAKPERAMAAQTLIHMADCYKNMGAAESRRIYQQVINDYKDQTDAVTIARAHLNEGVSRGAGLVTRLLLTGPKANNNSSLTLDGRYLSFVDPVTGDLSVSDLTNGTERRLTNNKGTVSNEYASETVISPDGKQVAYLWTRQDSTAGLDGLEARTQLRLISVDGRGTSRVLYEDGEYFLMPFDWSPDGKWIAVERSTKAGIQIGLIDPRNGNFKVVKILSDHSTWSMRSTKVSFSPDGAYLAFDLGKADNTDQREISANPHDIFVVSVDGSRLIPAVTHPNNDVLAGWSPDGKSILFTSDRPGEAGLWAVPFREGKPGSQPQLLRKDIGQIKALRISASGVLYYSVRNGGPSVYTASVNFDSGKIIEPATVISEGIFYRQPDWSFDGKYLSYVNINPSKAKSVIIRSMESGTSREIHPTMASFEWPRWSPDGRSFIVHGTGGLQRIDAQTGECTVIIKDEYPAVVRSFPLWMPDGRRIIFARYDAGRLGNTIVEFNLESRTERILFRGDMDARTVSVSPDGRLLAGINRDAATKQYSLMLIPIAEGEAARELLRMDEFGGQFTSWTPDGRSILFTKDTQQIQAAEVWILSIATGQKKQIDFGPNVLGHRGLKVQPGGNKVTFFMGGFGANELLAMENFLPSIK